MAKLLSDRILLTVDERLDYLPFNRACAAHPSLLCTRASQTVDPRAESLLGGKTGV
jgi:hypothetical protein